MSETSYIPISVATLVPSHTMGVDLFKRDEQSGRCVLYRGAEYPLREDDLRRLRGNGISRLFITKEARAEYQQYLRQIAEGSGKDETSISVRPRAMNEVVLDVLESAFAEGDTEETVSVVKQLGSVTSEVVSRDEFAASDLFDVMHHDYATFTHSANVAYYAGILASGLGFSDQDVELVIAGGLLHDLGKLEIPDAILTKTGKLDDEEFDVIRRHPRSGFRQLAHREDLTFAQLMMVYQHHERIQGGGYPVGSAGDEIHPWAKLCAVVDIYEAVTSQRPYRTPMPRKQAIELLRRDSGVVLDPEMVKCWISIIQNTMPT